MEAPPQGSGFREWQIEGEQVVVDPVKPVEVEATWPEGDATLVKTGSADYTDTSAEAEPKAVVAKPEVDAEVARKDEVDWDSSLSQDVATDGDATLIRIRPSSVGGKD